MDRPGTLELQADLVNAVRQVFDPSEVDDVSGRLRRAKSHRIAVAVLVGATLAPKPSIRRIRQGIAHDFVEEDLDLVDRRERFIEIDGVLKSNIPFAVGGLGR